MSDKDEGSRMKAEPELKPCPFCESGASIKHHGGGSCDIECGTEGCFMQFGADWHLCQETAVGMWNTRHSTSPVIDQALVDRIVERARNSRVALGEPDKGDLSYDLSNWAPQDFFAVANVLVGAHSAKYDLVSLFAAAMEEVVESSQNSVTRKAGNSTDALESVPANGLRLTEPRSGEGGA